jgi:hypothetical protein
MMSRDHYAVLEVERTASPEDIQRAHRTLALRYHPDRNAAPDAAAKMTAINEAWAVLGDPQRRRDYDARLSKPAVNAEIGAAIFMAAREVLMRGGWKLVEDGGRMLLLENARQRLRVVFVERIDHAGLLRLTRQHPEFCVVLALVVEGPVPAGRCSAIDLMHSERHGAPLPDGPSRTLLSPFVS